MTKNDAVERADPIQKAIEAFQSIRMTYLGDEYIAVCHPARMEEAMKGLQALQTSRPDARNHIEEIYDNKRRRQAFLRLEEFAEWEKVNAAKLGMQETDERFGWLMRGFIDEIRAALKSGDKGRRESEWEYLQDYHHATQTAIGLARNALKNEFPTEAEGYLDRLCDHLDVLHEKRVAAIKKMPKPLPAPPTSEGV